MISKTEAEEVNANILHALADDLNTPLALTEMHKLAKTGNFASLKASGLFLGIFSNSLTTVDKFEVSERLTFLIESLLKERDNARLEKDYVRADELRDGFIKAGVKINDTNIGITWELTDSFDSEKLEALK